MTAWLTPGTGRSTWGKFGMDQIGLDILDLGGVGSGLPDGRIGKGQQGEACGDGKRAQQPEQNHRPQGIGKYFGRFFQEQPGGKHKYNDHAGCNAHVPNSGQQFIG